MEFKALNEADKANEAMCMYSYHNSFFSHAMPQELTKVDDPELMKGAPVALQIVGPRLGDAQLLRDVELIDQVLNQS